MSLVGGENNRSVIPRWRTSSSFDRSPESSAVRSSVVAPQGEDKWFERSLAEWKESGTAGHLADVFSIAVVENKAPYLDELAGEVLKLGDKMPAALQRMARQARGEKAEFQAAPEFFDATDPGVVGKYISSLKAKAVASPGNGFLWNDLSYAYNLVGEREKSERAMRVALKVSDSHRLIARGASRLFMHHEDPDKALSVLKKAQGFSRDPWLLAAHVAVSQVAGTESTSLSTAKRLLESIGTGHRHSSELGMALATQEMRSGKLKRAKLIARESSVEATENALAQAVWLSPRLRTDVVAQDQVNSAQGAYEARSWDAYYKGDWSSSLGSVMQWLRDEPYSIVPALQGSFVSATFMQDYELSTTLAEFGLRHNPESWSLRNNYVVALAMAGRLPRADEEFLKLSEPVSASHDHAVWMATKGLLTYRHLNVEAARSLYRSARDAFEKLNDRTALLTLTLYQSIEEALVGNSSVAMDLVNEVYKKLGVKSSDLPISEALKSAVVSERVGGRAELGSPEG